MKPQMKQLRQVIIMLVLFLVALGGYFYYNGNKNDDTNIPEDIKTSILIIDESKINEVTITNGEEKIILEKKDKDLEVKEPVIFRVDSGKIFSFKNKISKLESSKLIGKDIKDLSQYGLEKPSNKITINIDDGTEKVIYLGDKTHLDTGYYVRIDEDKSVYLIDIQDAEKILLTVDGIRLKNIFTYNDDDINYFSLSNKGNNVFETKLNDEKNWLVTKPVNWEAEKSSVKEIISLAKEIKVKEFIPFEKSKIVEFELDKPIYSIEVDTINSQSSKLLIGKGEDNGGGFYAKIQGEDEFLILDGETFNFGDKKPLDIIKKEIFTTNINELKEIDFIVEGKSKLVKIENGDSEDESDDKYFINDVQMAENIKFKELHNALKDIKIVNLNTEEASSKNSLEIKYKFNDDKVESLRFTKINEEFYYVSKNDKALGVKVPAIDIEKINTLINDIKSK